MNRVNKTNKFYDLIKLADYNRSAGITDYAKALWWKFNDSQFRDAAARLQNNTQNITTADPSQLRQDAATLNKLRNNPVTWRYIQNQAKGNNSQFKQFVDKSGIISRWADPKNRDIENIQKTVKGLNPINFIKGSADENDYALYGANKLMAENSPYRNAIPTHYKTIWTAANPIYSGIAKAKRLVSNNINNGDIR